MDDAPLGKPDRGSPEGFEELRASRARIVAAADAVRWEIERDLHDGVQQYLVALAVSVQLAQQLVASDPAAARGILEEMRRDVKGALDGVRQLAWRVYPSLLRDLGLGEALRAMAAQAAVPTRVDAPSDLRFQDAIAEAVYFCCVETLHAVTGIANAANVSLSGDGTTVRFEVTVEGVGTGPQPELQGVADRIAAAGGSLTVSSEGATLRVSGTIPLVE